MGVRSGTIAVRFFCGLSLLLLSAAQQKAFALPAAAPAVKDSASRDPAKKKKPPLTLQQTLPDAYASRATGSSATHSAAPGDGRFPPFDLSGLRLAACQGIGLEFLPAPRQLVARLSETLDIPCLYSFRICVLRIGPPLRACAA